MTFFKPHGTEKSGIDAAKILADRINGGKKICDIYSGQLFGIFSEILD